MHNSSACKEWKIRRHKRHDDDGRRSDRSLVSGFPPSVYWLLTSIRKRTISSPVAEFVSQESWKRARNTNDDCCQMWGASAASRDHERRLSVVLKPCATKEYIYPKWHSHVKLGQVCERMTNMLKLSCICIPRVNQPIVRDTGTSFNHMTSISYYSL